MSGWINFCRLFLDLAKYLPGNFGGVGGRRKKDCQGGREEKEGEGGGGDTGETKPNETTAARR